MDITIPSKVCESLDIQQGDLFEVEALTDRGDVKLTYKSIYRKR